MRRKDAKAVSFLTDSSRRVGVAGLSAAKSHIATRNENRRTVFTARLCIHASNMFTYNGVASAALAHTHSPPASTLKKSITS
jgi:hypothetical protein